MPRRYEEPPIVEAVCDYRFDSSDPWDMAIPGLIFEQLRRDFPTREQQRGIETALVSTHDGVTQEVELVDRIRFISESGKTFVQVQPHRLSIHQLAPYESWENFLPSILIGRSAYTAAVEYSHVQRLALRYINDIFIPSPKIELKDYFRFYPEIGDDILGDLFAFSCQVQSEVGDSIVRVSLTNLPSSDPETVGAKLDIDSFCNKPGVAGLTDGSDVS